MIVLHIKIRFTFITLNLQPQLCLAIIATVSHCYKSMGLHTHCCSTRETARIWPTMGDDNGHTACWSRFVGGGWTAAHVSGGMTCRIWLFCQSTLQWQTINWTVMILFIRSHRPIEEDNYCNHLTLCLAAPIKHQVLVRTQTFKYKILCV